MNKLREKIKIIGDSFAISRILSAYTLSNIINFPEGDRYQVNINTFVKCLSMPPNPIGNVLIIQGGAKQMNSNSYYIRVASILTSKDIRVFIFEKLLPTVNFEFTHDVAAALQFIRDNFSGPITVIGYSMGGVLLLSYLSYGYDQADLYIPTCCPLDLIRFHKAIDTHPLFCLLQNRTYKSYQVKGYKELLEFSGTTVDKNEQFKQQFINNLNFYADKWSHKTIYIVSSDDPVTDFNDVFLLHKIPLTYFVKGGWHCCLDSIYLSTQLASNFIKNKSKGIDIKLEQIKVK